ncbi:FAD-dependent oxidoreductase [soil metagenome]
MTVSGPIWDDHPAPRLPRLLGDVAADVCVVGLGGAGLAAVGEAIRRGATVVGIDAAAVGAGAAGRNGGFLLAGLPRFHHRAAAEIGRERAAALYRLTIAEIGRIRQETPEAVRPVGSVRLASSPEEEEDCDRQFAAMAADGLPVRQYAGPGGRGLEFPTDGSLQPLRRCRALAVQAVDGGARLFERSPATAIAGDLVTTPGGRIRCDRVVVAVDGGLESVLPELAGRVRTARAQMLATAPVPGVVAVRPVYARWGYDYWQQLPDGSVAIGGFRDRGGEAEWTAAAEPTRPVQEEIERFLRSMLRVTAPVTHRWAGAIAFTPDGMPVLGEVRPGVLAAGAYSGTGNVLGAICGRAAVELALDGRSETAALVAGSAARPPA